MTKVLLLFAHPRLERSRVNSRLLAAARAVDGLTINDLYQEYPLFDVDVVREKSLLLAHDVVVLHHPFFWYSAPSIVKQWLDLVLEFGWAYGPGGTALQGKKVYHVLTTGGAAEAYGHEGRNKHTLEEFLLPFESTFRLCKMEYALGMAIQGTHQLSRNEIDQGAATYAEFLRGLINGR